SGGYMMYDLGEDDGLPLGLTMSLAEDMEAMEYFAALPKTEQERLIEYIKGSQTGDEARKRIDEVVELCHNHQHFY
ncbi:MAG: YdeI/OmpD-associated family protein, partial [Cellulosilyticaceae bacterium]